MSIERCGSNPVKQCASEVPPAPIASPAPLVCVDRVEPARVAAYSAERSAAEEQLYGVLQSVPTPGALELEVGGKVDHEGGKLKVSAARDESGEYLIRVEGQAQAAVAVPVAALEVGVTAALTYRAKTPEAAAELLHSLVAKGIVPQTLQQAGDAVRGGHPGPQSLERVELSMEGGPSLHGQFTIKYGAIEVAQRSTGYLDFKKHQIVTEQAVTGGALTRASLVAARTAFDGDLTVKMRTELQLPEEVFARVASGELSLYDVFRQTEATRKLVVEGEERSEVTTFFAPGYAQVKKFEAELDLDELVSNPTEPQRALKGSITTMMSDQKAVGTGIDLPGFNLHARAAVYSVSEEHLFHDSGSLQQELDTQRALH